MRQKLICSALALAACLALASTALADKLVCVSNENLRGEMTVNDCLQRGDKFGIVDQYGAVHMVGPEEARVMKKLNPELFQEKAYGIMYLKEAPEMKKLPTNVYQLRHP